MIPKDPPQYTISIEERKNIELKAAQRNRARQYFIKEISDPFRYIYDPNSNVRDLAMERVEATKTFTSHMKFFRPSAKNFSYLLFSLIIPVGSLFYLIEKSRGEFDARCRRGEIAYIDRNSKFI